jgi:hypothetical protein
MSWQNYWSIRSKTSNSVGQNCSRSCLKAIKNWSKYLVTEIAILFTLRKNIDTWFTFLVHLMLLVTVILPDLPKQVFCEDLKWCYMSSLSIDFMVQSLVHSSYSPAPIYLKPQKMVCWIVYAQTHHKDLVFYVQDQSGINTSPKRQKQWTEIMPTYLATWVTFVRQWFVLINEYWVASKCCTLVPNSNLTFRVQTQNSTSANK